MRTIVPWALEYLYQHGQHILSLQAGQCGKPNYNQIEGCLISMELENQLDDCRFNGVRQKQPDMSISTAGIAF